MNEAAVGTRRGGRVLERQRDDEAETEDSRDRTAGVAGPQAGCATHARLNSAHTDLPPPACGSTPQSRLSTLTMARPTARAKRSLAGRR